MKAWLRGKTSGILATSVGHIHIVLVCYIYNTQRAQRAGSLLVLCVLVRGVCGVHDPIMSRTCMFFSLEKNSYFFSWIFHSLLD